MERAQSHRAIVLLVVYITSSKRDFQKARTIILKTVVSLFSGCGGFDLGFKEEGFDLIYACDSDPAAVDCYSRNVDPRVFIRDVTSDAFHRDIASIGNCDIILGGFPCQGFSKAGPKNERDKRNSLYIEMKNAVSILRPHIFIAENVDGISQNFNGSYLKRIVEDFKQINYRVEYRILDAISFGLPQHRRRVFFVGIKQSAYKKFSWPAPTHFLRRRNGEFKLPETPPLEQESLRQLEISAKVPPQKVLTIKDALGDLLRLDESIPGHKVTNAWPQKYEFIFRAIKEGQKLCNVRHASTSVYTWQIPEVFGEVSEREQSILETIGKNRRHKKYGNIPNGNPLSIEDIAHLSKLNNIETEIETLLSKGYIKLKNDKYDLKGAMFCSGLFKRPNWDEPSPTVLTNFHNPRYFLHPIQNRPFSLRECARLQGFLDTFIFTDDHNTVDLVSAYRLVGNAVPPPVSRLFANAASEFTCAKRR